MFVREGGACDLTRFVPGDNGALFAPQGGLRISARGLARIGRMLIGQGTIDGVRILTPESVAAMTGPAWTFRGDNGATEGGVYCRYGLAIHLLATASRGCADDPGLPRGDWIGHRARPMGCAPDCGSTACRAPGSPISRPPSPRRPRKGRSGFTAAEERLVARAVASGQQRP